MKAVVFRAAGVPLTVEDVDIAEPIGREVLVRTAYAGVCHSDLNYLERPDAAAAIGIEGAGVLGHEAAGVVEAVGPDVSEFRAGDHVVACLSFFCGKCEHCLTGRTYLCTRKPRRSPAEPPRLSLGGVPLGQFSSIGGYAEQMLVHENALVKISDAIPLDRAALLSCGVITGVGAVLNRAMVRPGTTVAVFGIGGIGMSVIQGARIAGARRIIAIDIFDSKLNHARRFGATDCVNASHSDPVEAVRELTAGGADYSFEAVGKARVAAQAFDCLRDGGQATALGVAESDATITLPLAALRREKILTGSLMGSNRFKIDIPRLVDFYLQGRLMLDEMITHRWRLAEVNQAMAALRDGRVIRSLLQP